MREVIFDTETTGTRADLGHRIVEIGAVELIDGVLGEKLQFYFNPERPVDPGAYEVHGLGDDFLRDQPTFRERLADILEFFQDSPLIAHNADFDRSFLNAELKIADYPIFSASRFVDTLKMARRRYKSGRNSLDALCARLGVDNTDRTLHGALKDSLLLAQVYQIMITGEQQSMILDQPVVEQIKQISSQQQTEKIDFMQRSVAPVATLDLVLKHHQEFLKQEIKNPIWLEGLNKVEETSC